MFSKKWIQNIIGCALVAMVIPTYVWGFDAPAYFEKKCSGCHTIGEGVLVGPDLKDVTKRRTEAWIKGFIKDSEAMIASGDPIAVELFNKFKKKMPARDLEDADLKAMYEFLKNPVLPTPFRPADQATAEDVAVGRAIFNGTVKLENGGRACLTCHSAGDVGVLGGGTLGPDLLSNYVKNEDQKVNEAIVKMELPTMKQVYGNKPLTEQENFQIRAYLSDAAKNQKQSLDQRRFALIGLLGAVFIFTLLDYRLKKRSKKQQD